MYPKIERPTEPGVYWFRQIGWKRWKIEHAFRSEVDGQILVDVPRHIKGEWQGPIPEPPSEEPPALTPLASGPPQRRRWRPREMLRTGEESTT